MAFNKWDFMKPGRESFEWDAHQHDQHAVKMQFAKEQ
jgi:hypothetical protein